MGALAKVGWQRMDVLVGEHGAEDVLHMICDQVSNGMSLKAISQAEGVAYSVLWKWLSADDRMREYLLALEARADALAHEVVEISDAATPENAVCKKLGVDSRKWAASKWGKRMYGDEKERGGGGVTVVVNRGGSDSVRVEGNILTIEGD